jgi:hypothetical protein
MGVAIEGDLRISYTSLDRVVTEIWLGSNISVEPPIPHGDKYRCGWHRAAHAGDQVSTRPAHPVGPARVLIAGGGFAALEAALALRALAEDRVQLALISPTSRFAYRPAATIEATGGEPSVLGDLREIAADVGAAYHEAALEAVAPQQQRVRTCFRGTALLRRSGTGARRASQRRDPRRPDVSRPARRVALQLGARADRCRHDQTGGLCRAVA